MISQGERDRGAGVVRSGNQGVISKIIVSKGVEFKRGVMDEVKVEVKCGDRCGKGNYGRWNGVDGKS